MYHRRLRVERLLSEGREAETQAVLAKIRELETQRSTMPSKDGLDPNYKRLLFCRYADDFLIGVIGSKAEAREIMQEVTDFLGHQLRLEASPEKRKVSKATDGTVFLGYTVQTVTKGRIRRKKLRRRVVRSRANADRVHLRVSRERLVRFNQRQGYGDLGRLKAVHRRHLIDSSVLEIVLAYNTEMRGIANDYRLAYCAKFHLRKLWLLWETRLLKTLAFKLRLSVNQVARRLKTRDGLAVGFNVDGKERSVDVFNLKHIFFLPPLGSVVDRLAIPHFTKGRSDVMDRLRARRCEYCGSTENPCEVHHSRRLADVKDTPLWKQVAAARRRKRVVLCLPCHKALHAGEAQAARQRGHTSTESRMMGNYHVRFGGRERHVLIEARPSRPNSELGTAFLSNEAGILDQVHFENSAAYVASWVEKFQNDPRMIVSAASQAQQSADLVLGLKPKESLQECQVSPEGMPLTWAREHGIDTRIAGFAHRNPGGEGVSTFTEWKQATKPSHRLSRPPQPGLGL